jgi:hypothetical protein
MALCPLAAAVLVREGILSAKHLQLIPSLFAHPSSSSRCDPHDPTDPLSAIILSSYDVVGDVLLGAAGGPIEVGRRLGPQRRESDENEALARQSQASTWSRENKRSTENALMVGPKALVYYGLGTLCPGMKPLCLDIDTSSIHDLTDFVPGGIGTYKGCRKIVDTVVKSPMTYTHSLTRGFHNTPKLYGEQLRPREEVVDLRSGLVVGGKVRTHRQSIRYP